MEHKEAMHVLPTKWASKEEAPSARVHIRLHPPPQHCQPQAWAAQPQHKPQAPSHTLCTHSYSPFLESNVPCCRLCSFKVKRGPHSYPQSSPGCASDPCGGSSQLSHTHCEPHSPATARSPPSLLPYPPF